MVDQAVKTHTKGDRKQTLKQERQLALMIANNACQEQSYWETQVQGKNFNSLQRKVRTSTRRNYNTNQQPIWRVQNT